MRLGALGLRLGLLAILGLPLGCTNPFRPANPEPAVGGVPEDFSDPDRVLLTMADAIANKSPAGSTVWIHAFAESAQAGDRAYRQFYDGTVKQNWETGSRTAPEPWDIGLERGLPSRLFGVRTFPYTLDWVHDPDSPSDGDPTLADTVEFHRHYQVEAHDPNSANPEIIAAGFVDLSFQKTNGRWSIFRWHDRIDPVYPENASNLVYSLSRYRLESLTTTP